MALKLKITRPLLNIEWEVNNGKGTIQVHKTNYHEFIDLVLLLEKHLTSKIKVENDC